jgi:hypothetical protein
MTKTLTLEITDTIYEVLLETSAQAGQTPEQIILEWVEHRIKQTMSDPLLELAGTFESDTTDVSERHDEYFGAAVSDPNG